MSSKLFTKQERLPIVAEYENLTVQEYLQKCTPTFDCELTGNHPQVPINVKHFDKKLMVDEKLANLLSYINNCDRHNGLLTHMSCQYNWYGYAVVVFYSEGYRVWMDHLFNLGVSMCHQEHPEWFTNGKDIPVDDEVSQYNIESYIRTHSFIQMFLTNKKNKHSRLRLDSSLYENYFNVSLDVSWEVDAEWLPFVDEWINKFREFEKIE